MTRSRVGCLLAGHFAAPITSSRQSPSPSPPLSSSVSRASQVIHGIPRARVPRSGVDNAAGLPAARTLTEPSIAGAADLCGTTDQACLFRTVPSAAEASGAEPRTGVVLPIDCYLAGKLDTYLDLACLPPIE